MDQEKKDFLWERLTSRKLHITVVGFITATVFLYYGILPPEQWTSFMKWIFAIYVAGNSFEHFANQGIKLGKPKDSTKAQISQQNKK